MPLWIPIGASSLPRYIRKRDIEMKRQPALVGFSGGQDFTTCLFWALEHYEHVETVTFNYGQCHSLEIEVAKHIAAE